MSKISEVVSPVTSAFTGSAVASIGGSIVSKETNRLADIFSGGI